MFPSAHNNIFRASRPFTTKSMAPWTSTINFIMNTWTHFRWKSQSTQHKLYVRFMLLSWLYVSCGRTDDTW